MSEHLIRTFVKKTLDSQSVQCQVQQIYAY